MKTNTGRSLVLGLIAIAGLGVGACSSGHPRNNVRETQRVYRDSDEVCRQKVVTENRRERDGDRTRTSTTETTCRER